MRHLLTLAILLASFILYMRGFASLSLGMILAAGVLECWFWVRLFRGRPAETPRVPQQS